MTMPIEHPDSPAQPTTTGAEPGPHAGAAPSPTPSTGQGRKPLHINVLGHPAPQGSHRGFVVNGRAVVTQDSKKTKPWRQDVTAAAQAAIHETQGYEPYTGPVAVAVIFYMPRPGYHYGTGRNAGALKSTAPAYVDKKPDVDKLLRSTLDALTNAAVFRDDAQVAQLTGVKRYADAATGARITISVLTADSVSVPAADPPCAAGTVHPHELTRRPEAPAEGEAAGANGRRVTEGALW